MGYPSVSCYQSFDDDDIDANADDAAAFLSGTSLIFVDRLGFLSDHLMTPLIRLYLILLFQEFLFLSCLVSRSSFLCRPLSSLLFYLSSRLHQSSLAADNDTGDVTVDGKQRGLFRSSCIGQFGDDDDDDDDNNNDDDDND